MSGFGLGNEDRLGSTSQSYNIAIITGQLVVGGAERQLYLWLSHLDRDKFRPVVLTLHPGYGDYWENPIESLDIPLLRIPHRRIHLVRLLDIVRVLHPYKPQLIHGWHLFASPYAGAAAKILGAKSLGGLRGTFRTFSKHPLEANLTLCLVDAILVNSRSAADRLRAGRKFGKQPVYAVQSAVEDQQTERQAMRAQLGQRFGIPPEVKWLGTLGRLDPKKRFDLLLKVVALLREEVKDFHLLLIGNGPERARLEAMVAALGIAEFVTFAGEVPGASAWLSALDIFCFTSLDEGMPNVIMEAAVAGLPIVTWRVPFMEEILDKENVACLVEPENLTSFKDTVLELIQSRELRNKLGEAARSHIIQEFTLERYVQRMTSVYEDLLGIQHISDTETP